MKGNSFQDREYVISDQDRIGKFGELVTENWLDQSMKIVGLGELVNWERWQNWFVQDGMVELVKDLNWSIWW